MLLTLTAAIHILPAVKWVLCLLPAAIMTEHSYNKFHMHKRHPVTLSGQIVIQATLAKKRK